MKNKKIYEGDIAFRFYDSIEYAGEKIRDAHWEQMDYFDRHDLSVLGKDAVLKPNAPFLAKLQILSYSRGRSAANWNAVLSDIDGCGSDYAEFLEGVNVTIFMTDMLDIILKNNLFNGKTNSLHLAFCKRGMNYGLKCYEV
jgi:hypothetical protein